MKLIVGLGNPDDKYKNTFHNLGFMCVDKLCDKLNVSFDKTQCKALVAQTRCGTEKVIIAKPQTYMNLSGDSVSELVKFYKIDLKDVIVVYDDYDINVGMVRIRKDGSAGTHNGMRDIIAKLPSSNFPRIRIGFKPLQPMQIPLINYVLSGISEKDKPIFEQVLSHSANALYDFAHSKDLDQIMQIYNKKA